jgi:hypothetical protein
MIESEIASFTACLLSLSYSHRGGAEPMSPDELATMRSTVEALDQLCRAAHFSNAAATIQTTLRWLSSERQVNAAKAREIEHLLAVVHGEFEARQFFHLSNDRAKYFNAVRLFGEEVDSAFPYARDDIREAGNCMATERNTAAVFHLMRVVEWGLRALCGSLGMRQVRRSKRSHIPLAWADWETLLNQLQPRIESRINKLKRGARRQAEQEFYYPILQDIRGIKDAWRNQVMHTRSEYSRVQADAVFEHVRRIMSTLATRISENTVKRPKVRQAQYGIGGSNYRDVTELLRGYIDSGVEVLASNHFFGDPYPNTYKHLVVKFSVTGSRAVKTLTFREGQLVKFSK